MNTDFHDAHERHWEDAETLVSVGRFANADHLFGVSAECGLKRLMLVFGMPFANDMPTDRRDAKHIDQIWQRYEAYRANLVAGTKYALPMGPSPFDDWSVHQRYAARSNFDAARANGHKSGAAAVRQLISDAMKDGLI